MKRNIDPRLAKPLNLVILTSHRPDCFFLCMRCLETYTNLSVFSSIIIIANDVSERHRKLIENFKSKYKNIIDLHVRPRGILLVTAMEEVVFTEGKDTTIIKMDEDVFVTRGWLRGLLRGYRRYIQDDHAVFVSPVVPNNVAGREMLRPVFQERYGEEFSGPLAAGSVHKNPAYGAWVWDKVIHGGLEEAIRVEAENLPDYRIKGYFNINCMIFDERLIRRVCPFEREDEACVNVVTGKTNCFGVMTAGSVVHHYSFGPQQEELDKNVPLDAVRKRVLP